MPRKKAELPHRFPLAATTGTENAFILPWHFLRSPHLPWLVFPAQRFVFPAT
jgi:hypothetical protein